MSDSGTIPAKVVYVNGVEQSADSDSPPSPRPRLVFLLARDIRFFCRKNKISVNTLGNRAIGNGRLEKKLKTKCTISLEIADRIYRYMESQGFYFTLQKGE